jgi:hypothetical protein
MFKPQKMFSKVGFRGTGFAPFTIILVLRQVEQTSMRQMSHFSS